MMRKFLYTAFTLFSFSSASMAQGGVDFFSFARTSYHEVTVHDPSVVYDNAGTYYIFGSHRAVSKTTDLVNWTQCADNINSYGDFGWQNAGYTIVGNEWAPDVIWNPMMNKWLMYMSLNGDKWCSAIVCLAADKIDGPYVYQGPVIFSGFRGRVNHVGYSMVDDWKHTDLGKTIGVTSLPERYDIDNWGSYWPNCIDPCVTFDNGKLYMTYGSWSGGIFQIQLDPATGLRDYSVSYPYEVSGQPTSPGVANANCTSDPYFGKKLAGGYYVSGEGAYIKKIGKYYYLFLSYGGLESTGGYEMRVFRSEHIDGPYDYALYDSYRLNYGPNAKTNRGQRLLGAMGAWGAVEEGELAQGHNSVLVDEKDDAFVIYHTRYQHKGETHNVRVRQLFVNKNGFLVASPFRYTGKQTTQSDIESKQLFTAEQIAGTYQMMIHPYKLDHKNKQVAEARSVTLTADGKVKGEGIADGIWEYTDQGKSFVHLEIDLEDYYGVVLRQNVDHLVDAPAICFSAVKESYQYGGETVWLYKLESSTTGISKIHGNVLNERKTMYNIKGQRVDKNYKGVVIQNGKKFIRK